MEKIHFVLIVLNKEEARTGAHRSMGSLRPCPLGWKRHLVDRYWKREIS